MTLQALQKEFFRSSGKRIAPEDFFILLSAATKKEKAFLLAHPEFILDEKMLSLAKDFFFRRHKHEPVAYILGKKEFFGRDFYVNQSTLIPRPETEELVEHALAKIAAPEVSGEVDIVDVGTGCGAIILSLAHTLPKTKVGFTPHLFGIDTSGKALLVAQKNYEKDIPSIPVSFLNGSMLSPYVSLRSPSRSLIVLANLPYLKEALYKNTEPDVHLYEPKNALLSDKEGLAHYRELLSELALFRTQKKLWCFLEISPEQGTLLTRAVSENFPAASPQILQDLSGRDRFVFFEA